MPALDIQRLFTEPCAWTSYLLSSFFWQPKPFIIRLRNCWVSMYPYMIVTRFPLPQSGNKRDRGSLSMTSALFTVHYLVLGELEIIAQRLTIPTKQCNQMRLPLLVALFHAACYKRCRVLHSFFTSKCVVCFLRSSIQPSLLICLTFSYHKKKNSYIWDNRVQKGDVYTAHWSQYQALYTHCTLSQNTVMLEIRMAFHANRGTCCAGDRLLLQTELKWKTNPSAILNKTPLGGGLLR